MLSHRPIQLFLPLISLILLMGMAYEISRSAPVQTSVIISEVAWGGTAAASSDEWLELFNDSCNPVDLSNWTLSASDGTPSINLTGTLAAQQFLLLERSDDNTISSLSADFIFSAAMLNSGETLELRDSMTNLIDSANGDGGPWPTGSGSPSYASMARLNPDSPDNASGWRNGSVTPSSGFDANGTPVSGTPGAINTGWVVGGCNSAELSITLSGVPTAEPLAPITYTIAVTNSGQLAATGLILTNTIPPGFEFISTSAVDPTISATNLVFTLSDLAGGQSTQFTIVLRSAANANQIANNQVVVTTDTTEENLTNNTATTATLIGSPVLINALLPDAYNDGDESIALINQSDVALDISGWRLSDAPSGGIVFPSGAQLQPGREVWIAKEATAFLRHFGFSADFSSPDFSQSWFGLSNNGDSVLLYDSNGTLIDTVVYENGDTTTPGWNGPAVRPYQVSGNFGAKGQILYRKRDAQNGKPLADSDSVSDWAQDNSDPYFGKRIRYPGWNIDQFRKTAVVTTTANVTISITPDNAFNTVKQLFDEADISLKISIYRFTNYELMLQLIAAANRGVSIDLLQEGAPPGGLLDQQRYLCHLLENAGGRCWFMINENSSPILSDHRVWDRYRFLHAKYMIIDDVHVMISSDNFSLNSMPTDTDDGLTTGRRGVLMVTDSAEIRAHLTTLWHEDFAPATDYETDCRGSNAGPYRCDIFRWRANDPEFGTRYGSPPPGFIPETASGGFTYTVRYPIATTFNSTFQADIQQSPDNSLRQDGGLFGMVNMAGAGDTVYVQQLDERPHWGESDSNPVDDPNLRVEAYIGAARRGADLWIMLDSYFSRDYDPDDPSSNRQTCSYVSKIAREEGLKIRCILANPTDRGIHNKMVIASIGGKGYVHIGSINGSEQSSKGNRELAVTLQSDQAYALLADMFTRDWPHLVYLPIILNRWQGPAQYPLISEIYYNPPGMDDSAEFIELANPTATGISLDGWSIGDAVKPDDFEDFRIFPPGSMLPAGGTVVVALNGKAFSAEFGGAPDYEIVDSDPAIPNMIDDPAYDEAALLRLGNTGDELILRNAASVVIDAITYGTGDYPGVIAIPLPNGAGNTLERFPWWRDTNNGVNDFREYIATPGELPK